MSSSGRSQVARPKFFHVPAPKSYGDNGIACIWWAQYTSSRWGGWYNGSSEVWLDMADTLSPEQRSARMTLIRGKNTRPEMIVRRLVFQLGYRYRLHVAKLPGRPDLVFFARRRIILVHGCFWHRHSCSLGRLPKSRQEFWIPKLERNRTRDAEQLAQLQDSGWQVLVVWECELRNLDDLTKRIIEFLGQ